MHNIVRTGDEHDRDVYANSVLRLHLGEWYLDQRENVSRRIDVLLSDTSRKSLISSFQTFI